MCTQAYEAREKVATGVKWSARASTLFASFTTYPDDDPTIQRSLVVPSREYGRMSTLYKGLFYILKY